MWEFLRRELTPTPERTWAALRVLCGALVATFVINAFQMPFGHWVIITLFTVSLTDAGASLRKAGQRVVGTIAGGSLAIASAAFADHPWFILPLLWLGVWAAMFFSRTTSAPYTFLLSGITFAIFLPGGAAPGIMVTEVLWRILIVSVGVAIGMAAQLLLWPTDPQDLLRDGLATRLRQVAEALDRLARGADGAPSAQLETGPGGHTDLLASTEATHPSVRRRHAALLALVTAADRAATATTWIAKLARSTPAPNARRDLAVLAAHAAALADAVAQRVPPLPPPERDPLPPDVPPLWRAALMDVAGALEQSNTATAQLHAAIVDPSPSLPPPPLFTAACRLDNLPAMHLAIKAALGATLCTLLVHGLAWQGIATCIVTCVIVAQPTWAAARDKALLRIAGAALGAILGFATLLLAMPWLDSIAGLLLVAAPALAIAAYIVVGSPNISYAGIQVAMAYAMIAFDVLGPTTNLVPGRDRVVGILVGIVVMALLDRLLWPAHALPEARDTLIQTLRHMAALARKSRLEAAGHGRAAQDGLADALRLHTAAAAEPGSALHADERVALHDVAVAAQQVLLGTLALARHPGGGTLDDPGWPIASRLAAAAVALSGRAEPAPAPRPTGDADTPARHATRIEIAAALQRPLDALEAAVRAAPPPLPRTSRLRVQRA
ncbi:MAG: FUSC family protein [bacterium]|nr:FUSC family protein [bacterium]